MDEHKGENEALIVEENGVIVYASVCAHRVLGCETTTCLLGRKAIDFVPESERHIAAQRIKVSDAVCNSIINTKLLTLSGEVIPVSLFSVPIKDGCTLVSFVPITPTWLEINLHERPINKECRERERERERKREREREREQT